MLLTAELDRLSATDWQPFFAQERAKPYFAELDAFVTAAAAERTVYPAPENIFAAFRACPAASVRAVILGQDPYHEPGQAMGLSFSVPDGCKAPPSLRNIFKELESEFGPGSAAHTDLTPWARQGVLLLNTVLTVEQGAANAHAGQGSVRGKRQHPAGRGGLYPGEPDGTAGRRIGLHRAPACRDARSIYIYPFLFC